MSKGILALSVVFLPFVSLAQGPSPVAALTRSIPSPVVEGRTPPTWSVNLTSGFTNTFQLILGDPFGPGHDFQDKMTASINNAFLRGDSVSAFGWSTTDLSNMTPNWQAGLLYKLPIVRRKDHTLSLTAGGQRWILPLVGPGTKDWFVTGNLTYGTVVKRIPVFVSEDAYNLVKSNLPTGSALYSQIYTQQPLTKRHGVLLALREGPAYTYSWGLYGASGNRVVRYSGTLVSSWKGTTLETGYRKQFGLQDGIPNNGYWSILFTKQFTGRLHTE
ncbi:MAG TPA: hypothetical protein VMR02_21675 [Terracidiphilus sp.]|jgi:hypothetical protein|nr:hypothetical protein [Terracidiphilus sp.]